MMGESRGVFATNFTNWDELARSKNQMVVVPFAILLLRVNSSQFVKFVADIRRLCHTGKR